MKFYSRKSAMILICMAILLIIVAVGIIDNFNIPVIVLAPIILYLVRAWYHTYCYLFSSSKNAFTPFIRK